MSTATSTNGSTVVVSAPREPFPVRKSRDALTKSAKRRLIEKVKEAVQPTGTQLQFFYSREKPNVRKFSFSGASGAIHDAKGKWCILPRPESVLEVFNTLNTETGILKYREIQKALVGILNSEVSGQTVSLLMQALGPEYCIDCVDLKMFTTMVMYCLKAKTIYEDIVASHELISPEMLEPLVDDDAVIARKLYDIVSVKVKRGFHHFTMDRFLYTILKNVLRWEKPNMANHVTDEEIKLEQVSLDDDVEAVKSE